MAIDLASASAELRLDVSNFITNAQRASDAAQNIRSATDNATSGGFLGWVTDNEAALNRWGKGMLAVGGIITGAFAAPIIAGSRAAWGQVDAVEQATIAMNAYADSSGQVDEVLASLIAYARSDMGVLFQRQDLFAAAQSMLIYGASIEDVNEYTQILSRSVGLGLSDWESLNTIIGRVGTTGRLTGNDFDMLKARGFDLDESLRNTNITWEELFANLDKGIPADALAGQADTIRGKSIRLQSALRGLGLAFLGVDSETSKFIEGGLGWQMMRGMERLTTLMKRAAPAVQGFGNVIAAIGRPIGQLFDLMLRLPQPVQTAMLAFTALTGVSLTAGGAFLMLLPRIASTVKVISDLGGVAVVFGKIATALLSPVRLLGAALMGIWANPVLLAGVALFSAAILAYKTNFLGFADAVDWGFGKLKQFGEYLFGVPEQKTVNFDIEALADVGFYDWQEMPDGSYKNADLDITASGGGIGYVDYVLDDSAPDGKAWTLHVDVDGDGKEDALKIISSEKLPDGTFKMTVEAVDGTIYETWYDENSNQAIYLNVEANTTEAEASIGRIQQHLQDVAKGAQQLYQDFANIASFNWGAVDWKEFLGFHDIVNGLVNDWWNFVDAVYWGEEKVIAGWSATTSAISSVWSSTTEAISNAWDGIANSIISSWQSLPGKWDSITGSIQSAWDATTSELSGIWDAFVNGGFMSGVNAIGETVSSIISGIESFVGAVVGAIESVVNTALEGIQSLINLANKVPGINIGDVAGESPRGEGVTATPRSGSGVNKDPSIEPSAASSQGRLGGLLASIAAMTQLTEPAVAALGSLNDKMIEVDVSAIRSSDSFNTIASTVPMYTSATQSADQATGAMASNMGTSFGNMAVTAMSSFGSMQSEASAKTAAMNSLVSEQTSSMQASVAGHMLGMQVSATLQMALMSASASTQGEAIDAGLTGGIVGATANIAAHLGTIPGIIASVGSSAASTAYSVGANISLGFASGMLAYLGVIQSAANAMVSAASKALIAKAMISSPSRLFMQYGAYVGEGFELGILGSIPNVGRATQQMVGASIPSPALNTPLHVGGGGYGGQNGSVDNSVIVDLSGATFTNTSRSEMNAWVSEDLIPAVERASLSQRRQMGVR